MPGCFTLVVFLLMCGSLCSVSFPRSAVVDLWSVTVAFSGHTRCCIGQGDN